MFLLDTDVLSELRKGNSNKANENVINWARLQSPNQLYISSITILEIEMGILIKERKDPKQGKMLRHWIESHILKVFSERTLPIDTNVARKCAALHVPNPKSERDALIAATALVHGMTLVTRNTKDFSSTGVDLINPWES